MGKNTIRWVKKNAILKQCHREGPHRALLGIEPRSFPIQGSVLTPIVHEMGHTQCGGGAKCVTSKFFNLLLPENSEGNETFQLVLFLSRIVSRSVKCISHNHSKFLIISSPARG